MPEGLHITALDFLTHLIASQRHRHPLDNAAAIAQRFDKGEVRLRDATVLEASDLLRPGTDVWFYRTPAPEKPVPYEVEVVYEDAHILLVNKPPFLATMPRGEHITETATVRLRRLTGNNELAPAHRLDRLTSGLLLFTKLPEIRGAYQELFASRSVTKTYRAIAPYDAALARSVASEGAVEWASHITKTPGELRARVWPEKEPNTHTSLIEVRLLDDSDSSSLPPSSPLLSSSPLSSPLSSSRSGLGAYILRPHTGKTHQLRVHMASAGVPICGDPLYPVIRQAEEENFNVPLELKAIGLSFIDPLNGKEREFRI